MTRNDYSQSAPDQGLVLELTFNAAEDPEPAEDAYDWYDPGFFSRLTMNRPLLILLIIAFLLLVVGPSLFYVMNPPQSHAPRKIQGIAV